MSMPRDWVVSRLVARGELRFFNLNQFTHTKPDGNHVYHVKISIDALMTEYYWRSGDTRSRHDERISSRLPHSDSFLRVHSRAVQNVLPATHRFSHSGERPAKRAVGTRGGWYRPHIIFSDLYKLIRCLKHPPTWVRSSRACIALAKDKVRFTGLGRKRRCPIYLLC